jgi:hypothetical protein
VVPMNDDNDCCAGLKIKMTLSERKEPIFGSLKLEWEIPPPACDHSASSGRTHEGPIPSPQDAILPPLTTLVMADSAVFRAILMSATGIFFNRSRGRRCESTPAPGLTREAAQRLL